MADWQYTLELKDVYHQTDDGKMTINELAGVVAKRIKKLAGSIRRRFGEMADELENDILPLFEEVAEIDTMDVNDFDNAMYSLYEWADTDLGKGRKMCWVRTQ